MIKKTIGIVCAAAIVALLVFTVLHRDRYRSMLFDAAERAVPAREAAAPRDGPTDRRTGRRHSRATGRGTGSGSDRRSGSGTLTAPTLASPRRTTSIRAANAIRTSLRAARRTAAAMRRYDDNAATDSPGIRTDGMRHQSPRAGIRRRSTAAPRQRQPLRMRSVAEADRRFAWISGKNPPQSSRDAQAHELAAAIRKRQNATRTTHCITNSRFGEFRVTHRTSATHRQKKKSER